MEDLTTQAGAQPISKSTTRQESSPNTSDTRTTTRPLLQKHEVPHWQHVSSRTILDHPYCQLLEETGYYAHSLREIGNFFLNHRRSPSICRVFLATELEQRTASPEGTEWIGHEWVPLNEFEQRIRTGQIKNAISLAVWSLFRAVVSLSNISCAPSASISNSTTEEERSSC